MASSGLPSLEADRSSASGRSTFLLLVKVAPARTRATRWGALTARQRFWAAWISLKAMASPAARLPGLRVTNVAVPDGGKGGLDRVRGAQVDPVLGGVVVEREQHLGVVDGGSTS